MHDKVLMSRMNKRLFLICLLCFVLVFSAACGGSSGQKDSGDQSAGGSGSGTKADNTQNTESNDKILDQIRDRGFLIAGCKMDVPDLSYYDADTDSWSGLEVDLAYETAARIFEVSKEDAVKKKLVHFVGVTVADREEKLESGEVDCLFATYTITKERAERFALSASYYTDYIGLMVRTRGDDPNAVGSSDIQSIADLDGKYIGVPRNATTREDFLNYINTMNTIQVHPIFCEYESYEVLFKALKDGNIDVMSVDVSILKGYVDNSTKILKDRFAGQNYGAAVKKENSLLVDTINQTIEEHK
ncbi:MAG: transporter substrate-binding domain-containing protein [Eubacterium sp.]|nr:transporter substrate-binding domain-containing protein [Eubacterium sp.]